MKPTQQGRLVSLSKILIWGRGGGLVVSALAFYFRVGQTHYQCDQKKSPNVYKSCLKMISLEKW